MQQRELGKGGPKVGAIGLGCMSFAGFYGPTDEAEAHRTLSKALDLGVTHLDTARIYGMGLSETIIGSFLQQNKHHFTIATKGGIVTKPKRRFDNSPEHLRESLEGSLQRLGVDFVDLFYVHRREQDRPIEEVTETLAQFVKEGKIGGIGYSEISPASLRRAAAIHPVRAVQSEFSLWTRMPELGLIRACEEVGAAFVAFSPVARGMFADQAPDPATFGDGDIRKGNPRFVEPNFSANVEAIAAFRDYAESQSMRAATMALAWVIAQGDHIIPIPGTRTAAHLIQDAAAGSVQLTDAQLAEIDGLLPPGFAHGDRYTDKQMVGVERYC
ncbi:MAG: aldo/keto reductase [Pseudomonadota bacterium]